MHSAIPDMFYNVLRVIMSSQGSGNAFYDIVIVKNVEHCDITNTIYVTWPIAAGHTIGGISQATSVS